MFAVPTAAGAAGPCLAYYNVVALIEFKSVVPCVENASFPVASSKCQKLETVTGRLVHTVDRCLGSHILAC